MFNKTAIAALALSFVFAVNANEKEQISEATNVFDGKVTANMRGGTWRVIYSSAEGPEKRALQVLTERLGAYFLREGHIATSFVLPLEKDGAKIVSAKRDSIVIGVPSKNATLRSLLGKSKVPANGYLIKTFNVKGRNVVLLAGDNPSAVLWATFEFLDIVAPELEKYLAGHGGRYSGTFFRQKKVPTYECSRQPETLVRSVFSWGQVVDDYNAMFRAMARARFNRVLLWNDQFVVNAKDVVECAHSWGIQVYWGCSWGWTLSGRNPKNFSLERLADEVVAEWREKWKPMGGDGIYLQSFTETSNATIGGLPIPEAATKLVNEVSRRIRAEEPGKSIVWGLHSNSMRRSDAAKAIAKLDPSIEILWENCGGFPYWELNARGQGQPDDALCNLALANNKLVGFAWKAQIRMDWASYIAPAGPFMLGCAGEKVIARDKTVTDGRLLSYDEEWVLAGRRAWEHIRRLRSQKNKPCEFNAVVEQATCAYAFATQCQAELFWSSKDDWETVAKRARLRALPER
jgi:hypothetical protein